MGVGAMIQKLLGGDLVRLEAQNAAQQIPELALPADLDIDGHRVTVRAMATSDRDAILRFARALPEHDLLFLRRDITQPENVDEWVRDVEAGRYHTLVAAEGADIVGYTTVASDGMTWTRHVAELRLLLAPHVRRKGLGRVMIEQSFRTARDRGIKKIIAQMTTDQHGAIKNFERLGFEKEAVLRDQVMDRDGRLHDLQIMGLDLPRFQARLQTARNALDLPTHV